MKKFDEVGEKYRKLKWMNEERADYMRSFIEKNDLRDIMEIGFLHGKSSAYFAAILEDRRAGHLTTFDLKAALNRDPNIFEILDSLQLGHRVTTCMAERSYTWELSKLIQTDPRPQFDFCYYDGGHTWDFTGFGFLLVDMLLKPGGWIAFDDLNWTIDDDKSPQWQANFDGYSTDEKQSPGVRMVYELIAPHLGYGNFFEEKRFGWGFAQKKALPSNKD